MALGADYTPVQYIPPVAVWVLLGVGPAALLAANLLAAWPGQRAARLRVAQVLRTGDRGRSDSGRSDGGGLAAAG